MYSIRGGSMTAGTTVLRKNENALEIFQSCCAILLKKQESKNAVEMT